VTVEPTQQPGAVQAWGGDTGLEDFAVSDAVLPRIRILQQEGLWEENLGKQKFQILRFIPLGLVKQRVLFHHKVEDGDVPMCKSSDFEVGFPNPEPKNNKSFPWELSGFDPANFPPNEAGFVRLPCDGCQLKEWGTNPATDAPYCAEQWTLPIYFDVAMDNSWAPAILTLQKSSIKPIRSYYTSYATSNQPPFIHIAQGSLKITTRGQNTYSVPTFVKEGESPRERWQEFQDQFKDMRGFLRRPPYREDDPDSQPAPSDNTNHPPEQVVVQQPVVDQTPPPQPVQSGDPWATTAQPAPLPEQPVAAQPAPVPVQSPAPAPQPVAPAATAPAPAQPAPVAAPVPAQPAAPPVQQAPAPQVVQQQAPPPVAAPVPEQPSSPAPAPAPVPEQPQAAPVQQVAPPVAQPVAPQVAPAPAQPAVAQEAPPSQQPPAPAEAVSPPPAGEDLPF
jgi:hypothetical protein